MESSQEEEEEEQISQTGMPLMVAPTITPTRSSISSSSTRKNNERFHPYLMNRNNGLGTHPQPSKPSQPSPSLPSWYSNLMISAIEEKLQTWKRYQSSLNNTSLPTGTSNTPTMRANVPRRVTYPADYSQPLNQDIEPMVVNQERSINNVVLHNAGKIIPVRSCNSSKGESSSFASSNGLSVSNPISSKTPVVTTLDEDDDDVVHGQASSSSSSNHEEIDLTLRLSCGKP